MQLEVQLLMGRALVVLREQVHRMSGEQGTVPGAPDPALSPATLAMKDRVPLSFWAMTILWMVNTNWASLEMPGEGRRSGAREWRGAVSSCRPTPWRVAGTQPHPGPVLSAVHLGSESRAQPEGRQVTGVGGPGTGWRGYKSRSPRPPPAPGVLPAAHTPGGNWKGTGTPSWTEEPSGRASLVLSESSTLSSMFLRKLQL